DRNRVGRIATPRFAGPQLHGSRDASETAVQSRLALTQFFLAGPDRCPAPQRYDVSHRVLHRAREGTRNARAAFRDSRSPFRPAPRQTFALSHHWIRRAVPDCFAHAFCLSRPHSRQSFAARTFLATLPILFAVDWHSRFQQSKLAGRSHTVGFSYFSAQYFLFRLHFSTRNHAVYFSCDELFSSRQLLHQHHPRYHSSRRGVESS